MSAHRVEAIIQAICKSYGLCDSNTCHQSCEHCCIDETLVQNIIKAIDQADLKLGIVRIPETANTQQVMVGMRMLVKGQSPSIIYKEMVKAGITNTEHPVFTHFE